LIAGDSAFEDELLTTVCNATKPESLFDYLRDDALREPPPLTFFKKFAVEEDAPHKDKFNVRLRAIVPLSDAARLFALKFQLRGVTHTFQRFKQLATLDTRHSEVYLNAAESWALLSKFVVNEGMKYDQDDRFLDMETLS